MKRRRGQTMAVSMTHSMVLGRRFVEVTGARRPPKHDVDPVLVSALRYAKNKTGLGYRFWLEFTRDFPKVRDEYSGEELQRYDTRVKEIYRLLKHRDNKYMSQFALNMRDGCEVDVRAYRKKRAHNHNERRPRCTNPTLRQNAGSCTIYGQDFKGLLSDAPNLPLQASPYVVLRFPIMPHKHAVEVTLAPYVVKKLAEARSVGAVTINYKTISIAYEPQPVLHIKPKGVVGVDVNKFEHVVASTDGEVCRIPNDALGAAQTRRDKHATLGVVGGKPKSKKRTPPKHTKHPGRKPKSKKRRDERVNRRERAKINVRYGNQKQDWLFKLMHVLAVTGFALVLEEPTIDKLLKKKNKRMSAETRDLLKMGLSQGTVWAVAKSVYKKHGLPVFGVVAKGTSSKCPICGEKLWAPKYNTSSWQHWRRTKACTSCLFFVDRDDVAAINVLIKFLTKREPAWVVGDWEQLAQQTLSLVGVPFPYVGEGRQPKGEAASMSKGICDELPSLADRLDVSNVSGVYARGTHPESYR